MVNLNRNLTQTNPSNPDEITIVKRRPLEFLPAIFQTDVLRKFFASSLDHAFQPQISEELTGYIGGITSYYDPIRDFYLAEPNDTRANYQLTPILVSRNLKSNELQNQLYYDDLINYIRFKGGNTDNHNRLFEQEYYSWLPPIDIDKFMNFRDYFWMPLGPETLIVDAPSNIYQFLGEKEGTVIVDGQSIALSSGMKLFIVDDTNYELNGTEVIVEGVGREIIFVSDLTIVSGWDLVAWDTTSWDAVGNVFFTPDYTTIERGCSDNNQWSVSNRWFHRDVIKNFFTTSQPKTQASRPIIEFERDIELWGFGDVSRGTVDLVITACTNFYNVMQGLNPGWAANPWSQEDIGCGILLSGWDSIWPLQSTGFSEIYVVDEFGVPVQIRDGMRILLIDDQDPGARGKIVEVTGIAINGSIILQFVNNGLDPVANPVFGETVLFNSPSGLTRVYYFNGIDWVVGQTKERSNQPPTFMLYDTNNIRLSDLSVYPASNFDQLNGSEIFEYNVDDDINSILDPILGLRLIRNNFDEITFKNTLVEKRFSYIDSATKESIPIDGYYFWRIKNQDKNKEKFSNNWHLVPEKSKQFYVQRFTTIAGLVEYPLDILPSLPYTKRNSTIKESIIAELDGQKLVLNVDYTIDTSNKLLILTNSTTNTQILIIRILSDETPVNGSGSYSIPLNLEANADNGEVGIAGFNQLFEHFYSNIEGQLNLIGSQFSRNNYRDTSKSKYFGEAILQHTAPLLKTMLIAADTNIDIINSIKYSEREYVRFKNKFIQKITNFYNSGELTEFDTSDPNSNTVDEWINQALEEINIAKNDEFPFKNTGAGRITEILTERTFIPPTPAYLGITPVYEPKYYIDDTYEIPVRFIEGHDGSLTPTFDDFRDNVLLGLENRIYNSILDKFKTEKLPNLSKFDVLPGKFRKTTYLREETLKILQPNFELWVAQAGVDYKTNNGVVESEFGLNYRLVRDRDGEELPGSFRGIYDWYYDTDRPHITPWEMLGFSIKPTWWETEYGVAPYTSGNTKLWSDLEEGLVRQGPRAGYDSRFTRSGLSKYIPVSTTGELLTPNQIGMLERFPNNIEGLADWAFGDRGPIESAWTKSEFYLFDLLQAYFLLSPNKTIELNWDNNEVSRVYERFTDNTDEQIIYDSYKLRPENKNVVMHDETIDTAESVTKNNNLLFFNDLFRGFGVQQYISSYLESQGKSISPNFGDLIRGVGVQLGHKAAGFIDQETLRLDSDSFGRVPVENVEIAVLKTNSIKETFYGGVIVEKTNKGYKVYGYDLLDPVFNTIPGDTQGKKTKVGVGINGNPFENWNQQTKYVRGDIVFLEANNQFYRCLTDHISTAVFQSDKWQRINKPPTQYQLSVIKYLTPVQGNPIQRVEYGSELQTVQQVFNLLIDYERYLVNEGFIFDTVVDEANDTLDWTWSGKEFMSWVIGSPEEGDIIALSPSSQKVKFKTDFGQVEPIEQIIRGVYSLVNRDGVTINPRNTVVSRLEGEVEIRPIDDTDPELLLFSTRLYVTEIEHSILIANTTIFNDIVYDALFNIRQQRLRLTTIRAGGWRGRYDAPGFIITENQLLPNYDKLADQFRYIFDINKDNLVEKNWRTYGYHNIGYQNREYLDQLIISEKSQLNFYQGMIGEKGTKNSFNRLLRSEFITKTSDLFFYEEWAFRVGQYGDYDKKPSLEVLFPQDTFKQNPQRIDFDLIPIPEVVETGTVLPEMPESGKTYFFNNIENQLYAWDGTKYTKTYDWDSVIATENTDNPYDDITTIFTVTNDTGRIVGGDSRWQRRPDTTVTDLGNWIWNTRESEFGNEKDLPNAGYAKIDEATYYAFNAAALLDLHNQERKSTIGFTDGERIWNYNTQGLYGFEVSGRGVTKYADNWSMFRVTLMNNVSPIDIQLSEDRGSMIITFNQNVSLFDQNGDLLVSGSSIIPDDILDNTTFSNNLPPEGIVTTSSVSNSFFVTTSAGYAVSSRTQVITTTVSSSVPIEDSIFSAFSFPVVIPSAGTTTTSSNSTKYYVTSSSFVTHTITEERIESVEVSIVPVSVNYSPFINQATCEFRPAFEDNVFVVGAPLPENDENIDLGPTVPTSAIPVPPNSFNIIDINDVITLQSNDSVPLPFEGSYVVEEIISPNQIRVQRPLGVELDISEDDFNDDLRIISTFIFKELRFKNTDEFNSITNSILYRNDFFNNFDNEIFYIDDARTPNEQTLIQPYYHVTQTADWDNKVFNILRIQENKVNNNTIFNALIYDKILNKTIVTLSLYDPYKGVIPGIADNEIWYKLDFDPAKYTVGDSTFHQIDVDKAWNNEQVGRLWWDLNSIRYLDYEISDNGYRRENWGRLAPGSSVDIYEWVRSSLPPLEYQIQANQNTNIPGNVISNLPSGEIFSPVNPAYSQFREYDEKTKTIKTFYYFWVKNKITLPNVHFRNISSSTVANIIRNPTASGINWFAPINTNSVVVGNVFEFLASDRSVLQVNWKTDTQNTGNWHKQWLMGRDGDPSWAPEEIIYNKMIDSLVGYDNTNQVVPDPSLNDNERYGIFYRPRQTMFVNKTRARSNLIEYFNFLIEQTAYNERLDALSNILVEDSPPVVTNHTVDTFDQRDFIAINNIVAVGETVLVNQNPQLLGFWSIWQLVSKSPLTWSLVVAQSYKTEDFIIITDWFSSEVDKNNPPIKIYRDIPTRNTSLQNELIALNDIIEIEDVNNSGMWEWQRYDGLDEDSIPIFTVVARENSTISLSNKFVNNDTVYGINEEWSSLSQNDLFNKIQNRDGSIELRTLFNIFRYEENTLTIEEINRIFFKAIEYAHSENQIIDWAFKSSYIIFGGTTEAVNQEEILRPTLFDSLIEYISEIKPYHVKFREFARRIATAIDIFETDITDFDFPPYYDIELDEYRILDINNPTDLEIISSTLPWKDWYENYLTNPQLIRNITITQKFDRVSCSPIDNDPLTIKIFADGNSSLFDLIINNSTIITSPVVPNYNPYVQGGVNSFSTFTNTTINAGAIYSLPGVAASKDNVIVFINNVAIIQNIDYTVDIEQQIITFISSYVGVNLIIKVTYDEEDGPQRWTSDNIDRIFIKNKFSGTIQELNTDQWSIFPVVINQTLPDEQIVLRLVLDVIPNTNEIIEIERRIFAADRIDRFYQPITALITGKPANEIIPARNSQGLISGCSFVGTTVEGGNYKLTSEAFQQVQQNYLNSIWDLIPNSEFVNDKLIDLFVKLKLYDQSNPGFSNFEKLLELNNVEKFNEIFKEMYSWDSHSWDGAAGVTNSVQFPAYISAVQALYDTIVSGISTTTSGVQWQTVSSPLDSLIDGNKFIQPYLGPNRPEELTLIKIPDPLLMDIYTQDYPGAPKIYQFRTTTRIVANEAWYLPGLAQSRESVFVYVGGRLLKETSEYVINWNLQTITFLVNFSNVKEILEITIYSTGGLSNLIYTKYSKASNALMGNNIFEIETDSELQAVLTPENMFVTYDGYIVPVTSISNNIVGVDTSGLSLNQNSSIIFNIYSGTDITKVRRQDFFIVSGQTEYFLYYPSGPESPVEQSMIVFNNGFRQLGPIFKYFTGDGNINVFDTGLSLSQYSNITVLVNGITNTNWTISISNDSIITFANIPEKGAEIIIRIIDTSTFTINNVSLDGFDIAGSSFDNSPFESNENLTGQSITFNDAAIGNFMSVVTFNNNRSTKFRTEYFKGRSDSTYPLAFTPSTQLGIWASVSGKNKSYVGEYDLITDFKENSDFIYNTTIITFLSSGLVWDQVLDDKIISFNQIKFKDQHLITFEPDSIVDFSTTGFDANPWEAAANIPLVSADSFEWDNEQPTLQQISNAPGFDNSQEELFDVVGFDIPNLDVRQDDVYITYMTGYEKSDGIAYRSFTPAIGEKEFIRIADSHTMYLKTDISSNSTHIELFENIELLPALINKNPLMTPNISENIPGVVWVNGERIHYWELSDPQVEDDVRYWTVSNLTRGTKQTSSGITEKIEYFSRNGNGVETEFFIDSGLTIDNTIVQLFTFTRGAGIWEGDNFSDNWDEFAWDSFGIRTTDTPLTIKTSGNAAGDYIIDNGSIIFNEPPILDPLSPFILIQTSAGFVEVQNPLPNILVTKIISNWNSSQIIHTTGSIVISGSENQRIPGGYDPMYNKAVNDNLGLQNQLSVQAEFLANNTGKLNKP